MHLQCLHLQYKCITYTRAAKWPHPRVWMASVQDRKGTPIRSTLDKKDGFYSRQKSRGRFGQIRRLGIQSCLLIAPKKWQASFLGSTRALKKLAGKLLWIASQFFG